MLILYTKTVCPFCEKVKEAAADMMVEYNERNIEENETYLSELLEKGGTRQVPFLVDEERDVAMYESDDIIEYLREHYAGLDNDESAETASEEEETEDDQERWG